MPTEAAANRLESATLLPVAADLADPDQPTDVIYGQSIREGEPVANLVTGIPIVSIDRSSHPKKPDAFIPPKRSKISAELAALTARLTLNDAGDETVKALVLFRETIKLPKFPRLRVDAGRDAPDNVAVLERSAAIIEKISQARAPGYSTLTKELAALGVVVRETYWLINAVSVELPARLVNEIAGWENVVSIDAVISGGLGSNELSDARAIINSDSYYNVGLTFGYIGILDSGVRSTHTLLTSPSRLAWVRDCVNGTTNNCGTGSSLNPADDANHGTSVASIISGNSNQGANNRGVTGITVDSFRVTDNVGAIYGDALIRSYQAAIAGGDNVISASLQRWEDQDSTIAAAADGAFDAGSVILACQGNQGPSSSEARCPGNARKVLAVGAIDVTTQNIESYSSRGPATDGRTKPDIVAPVNVRTASSASDTAYTSIFNGCSAATPLAAGAAGLWRNWVSNSSSVYDPGMVAAFAIAGASGYTGSVFDYTLGAGTVKLLSNATWYGGKTTIPSTSTVVDNPVSFTGTVSGLEVAIWWPETSAAHNDVDLVLVNPSGTEVASSTSSSSIWEKVQFATTTTGTWKVRIKGYNIQSSQGVYWVIFQRY